MSIKQFYRTNVAFVELYSYWEDGESINSYTNPVWTKGNLQPFKQGNMVGTTDDYLTVFTDWKVLYVKTRPVTDKTGVPPQAVYGATYFFYNGDWYIFTADQDWTTAGRGVKHWKILAFTADAITDDLPEPIPIADLVENFESVVSELNQTIPLITKEQ